MDNEFIFRLEHLPHPYPTDAATPYEAWGRLLIAASTNTDVHVLVDIQWNLDALAEWFIEHHHELCVETVTINNIQIEATECLAHVLWRIQDPDIDDDEADSRRNEALYAFREAHSLSFALRGSIIPAVILGKHHGEAEISSDSEDAGWCYRFPDVDLCSVLHQELHTFLRAWRVQATDPRAISRADDLLRRLGELPRNVMTD